MTKEQRILFELSDLKAVRLVCRKCKWETHFPIVLGERAYLPSDCPHCHVSLGADNGPNTLVGEFLKFLNAILEKDESLTISLKFEMDDEE